MQKNVELTISKAKLLLVEDNDINRAVANALLAPLQGQVDTATNGIEAVEMVQKKQYDMVLMDHYMPEMDGLEATKKIRSMEGQYYQNLPIIAVTADLDEDEEKMFFASGMNDVVEKPMQMASICAIIRKYLPESLIDPA